MSDLHKVCSLCSFKKPEKSCTGIFFLEFLSPLGRCLYILALDSRLPDHILFKYLKNECLYPPLHIRCVLYFVKMTVSSDHLTGTAAYGTVSNNPTSSNHWSIAFNSYLASNMLIVLANGLCTFNACVLHVMLSSDYKLTHQLFQFRMNYS
jgi:hypothetical protein